MTRTEEPPSLRTTRNVWDWQSATPTKYRNHFWENISGSSHKRDVFLAIRDANPSLNPVTKGQIAERVRAYPEFRRRLESDEVAVDNPERIDSKYLGGRRESFRYPSKLGGVFCVPRLNKPTGGPILVRVLPVLEWLINPVHGPISEFVARVIAFITGKMESWEADIKYEKPKIINKKFDDHRSKKASEDGTNFPLKAYLYGRTAEYYELDQSASEHSSRFEVDSERPLPTITFEEFGPYKIGDGSRTERGFDIHGSIAAEGLTVSNRYNLETELLKECVNIASQSADRVSTPYVDFNDVGDDGDVNWHFDIEDEFENRETTIVFEYSLKPTRI